MTEREKMLAGLPYDSRDEELLAMYQTAKEILREYNQAEETGYKNQLLKRLLGSCGAGVWIESGFQCDYGSNIFIGKNTFINYNCVFIDDNIITIGENCLIAPMVQILTAEHPVSPQERIQIDEKGETRYRTHTRPVSIGNNVWIGGGAVICPGVCIGNNAVIGAGSVVTKDIPSDMVAYGVPCKPVHGVNDEKTKAGH